ncbi:MAG: secretin N-terminal domain-containing protein [Sedimentisphaerales bacterium]
MRERHFLSVGWAAPQRRMVLAVSLLLCSGYLLAAGQSAGSETRTVGHKVFTLTHIPAEQGKKYLRELNLGTVSQLPKTNSLLVTGQPQELAKAITILKLVDAKEQFVIRAILPASAAKSLPSNNQIANVVGDILIGNFSNPPVDTASAKAIIDIHNGAVLAIAPASQVEKIVSVIESAMSGQSAGMPKAQQAERITFQPQPWPKVTPNIIGNYASGLEDKFSLNDKFTAGQADIAESRHRWTAIRSYEPEPIANGNETLTLNLPDKVDIVHLLGLAGQYLNLDFMYDPVKVKGDVTLLLAGKLRGPIQVKDLYPLLESVLKFKGFVMTRHKGNLVTVVPVNEALNIDPELLETEQGKIEYGDLVVTRPFRLEHIDTASAKNLLTNMKLGVDISEIAEAKTLIVTEFAHRMPRVEAILEMVDKPGEPKKFRYRQLQYTMAKTLAPKLQTLAEQLGTISITIAAEPTVRVPTVTKRPGETEASYRARLAAAQRTAAAARARARQVPAKPTEPAKPTVYLDADERTNRILMIGLQEQLNLVEELIDTLDVEQQDLRTLMLYKIKHVEAEEVRKKLEELGIIGAVPETPSRITTPTKTPVKPATPTVTRSTTTATEEALAEQPQVVVIEPTNSLLVNATFEQHTKIATIISYADSEMEAEEIPYQLYPLENQSPAHLAEVLQSLIQETVQDKEGKIEKVIKREEEIVIVPDPNTFSLIVYASKKNQEWIANLIEKLDKRRPQVLIDVTLVEISKSDMFNYDLNLLSSFPDLTDTSGLTSAILPGSDGINLVSRLLDSQRDRFIDFQSDSGMGIGFYGDRHVNALLTAMQEKGYGRVLAKPKILVNDNMPGTISTTDTTYVTRTSSIPVTTGAAGQQATLIETQVQFEGYDAGIELTITPHISEGELLRLDINLMRSDFGTITGEKPPDTTTSEINTTVTVPDGSTIILGGLLKLNQSKGGTKVPILGDIPLVGGLFRGISNSDIQKKLYIFVKAEVIRPEDTVYAKDDLERISERNRTAFERHEQEFQKYQDWPGIKPRPTDPLKVLEAE